jgi:glycosyltransferase involved in cell wall biosynthesis
MNMKVLVWNGSELARVAYVKEILRKRKFEVHDLYVKSYPQLFWNTLKLPILILKSDIVLTFPPSLKAFMPVFLAKMFGKPRTFDMIYSTVEARVYEDKWKRGSLKERFWRFVESRTCRMADMVFTHSESEAEHFSKFYDIKKEKIIPLYSFIDQSKFKPMNKDKKLLRNLNLEDKFVVCFHGSFLKMHGTQYMVKAIPHVLKKHPKTMFLFIGYGAHYDQCISLAKKLGVEKNTIFTGKVNFKDIQRYLSLADVWLGLFSAAEKAQRVSRAGMFEVMAMGIPVITARNRDVVRIFKDMGNIVFTNAEDPKDLAEKIIFLIENTNLRKKIGKNALEFVDKTMSLSVFEKKIISFINNIANKKCEE